MSSNILPTFRPTTAGVGWTNLERIRLPVLLKRKEKYIWVPSFDPEDIKILSLGPSGTLVKRQASPELISDYGSQSARL